MRPSWRRHTVTSVGVLALAATALSSPALAATDSSAGEHAPIVGSAASTQATKSATVTLISGDRVRVSRTADGQPIAQLLPSADGTVTDYETQRDGDNLYVFPADVSSALATGRIDKELFNVTGLVANRLDDAHSDTVQLIAQYDKKSRTVGGTTPTPQGATDRQTLTSINAVAYAVPKDDVQAVWKQLTDSRSRTAKGLRKLWLDRPVKTTLASETKQVGAPSAWQAGLDGKGSTVAVLDTGVDAGHPDLAGQIEESKDFTDSPNGTDDLVGHGTHVASTVAGTGAASDGKERGVAPGANLIIGKVLDDGGFGSDSDIIAGMQWAVSQDADVVSMSLGSQLPTVNCDDPIAQSMTALSNSSSSLFVVAAGNLGSAPHSISSPGCVPDALTVGAVDSQDKTAYFSSRGPVSGTHVLKPEIAAPGVNVLAASAGGRGIYAYRTMSGTSMATPIVAGAAAIAKEANPGFTGAQLKRLLTSSARSDIPGGARQVGAGEVDITRMLKAHVTAPSSVYGGEFDYPQTKETVAKSITYTNRADKAVNLRLNVTKVTGNDGDKINTPLLRLPQHVTVPAHGSVKVPVKVQLGAHIPPSSLGDITARIIATGGGQHVSTAFNLYAAPPAVTVKVKVIDRNGDPATGASSVDLVDTDTSSGERRVVSGKAQEFTVRPGHFFVTSYVMTDTPGAPSSAAPASLTYVARPEVTINKDTTIVLDARKAHPLTVSTDKPSEQRSTTLTFDRQWADSWLHSGSMTVGAATENVYADVRGKVSPDDGSFEFGHWTRRSAPIVSSMKTSDGLSLHPLATNGGTGNLDGTGTTEAVSVGAGTADDFSTVDVRGKIAVAKLGATDNDYAVQTRAKDAGATALLLYRDEPGTWLASSRFFAAGPVPTYTLPQGEGTRLASALAAGPVTLDWKARATSPYAYTLGFFDDGQLVTAQRHRVSSGSLGSLKETYNSMGVQTNFGDMTAAQRPDGVAFPIGGISSVAVPSTRTEYVSAGDTKWLKSVISSMPFGEVLSDKYRTFAPGESQTTSWYGGSVTPGVRNDKNGTPQLVAERQGNLLGFAPTIWADSAGHWSDGGSFGDLGSLDLSRNGEHVGHSAYAGGVFTVPAGDATYDLTMNTMKIGAPAKVWERSTQVRTTWTFHSQQDADVYSQPLALLFPRLDLPTDGMKTVAAGTVTIPARVQANPGYDAGKLSAAKVWTSTDGGDTWVAGTAKLTASGAELTVDNSGDSGKQVSLRVELTDAHGAKVQQTITRAYDVR